MRRFVSVTRRFCTATAAGKPAETAHANQPTSSLPVNSGMRPSEIVKWLDQFIIGQSSAKRAVANALRNRWRRQQLPEEIRSEITPRNILMVGPTGVGKTEIARRLAKLADAPFIKVEATKYTEVGFHGKDVDSIIKDLVDVSLKRQKMRLEQEMSAKAEKEVEGILLNAAVGNLSSPADHETWLGYLRQGLLDDKSVTVEVPISSNNSDDSLFFDPTGSSFRLVGGRGGTEKKRMTVADARKRLLSAAMDRLIPPDVLIQRAVQSAEQEGIVFIDEIDKICNKAGFSHGVDASGEGVQRDLLPIIEGCEVSCGKYGNVKTDHVLFICAGAFHSVKPSDMLAELQGRLPVRVQLHSLSEAELVRVLKEPKVNVLKQQELLMSTEGVTISFPELAVEEIAKVAAEINKNVENIGARRLHTVVERIMEDISFRVADDSIDKFDVNPEQVRNAVVDLLKKTDLHKFIL